MSFHDSVTAKLKYSLLNNFYVCGPISMKPILHLVFKVSKVWSEKSGQGPITLVSFSSDGTVAGLLSDLLIALVLVYHCIYTERAISIPTASLFVSMYHSSLNMLVLKFDQLHLIAY